MLFAFIVIMVTAAVNIYSLSKAQYLNQIDKQLMLLANHKTINQFRYEADNAVAKLQHNQVKSLLQSLEPAVIGILVFHDLPVLEQSLDWISNQKEHFNEPAFNYERVAEILAKAAKGMPAVTPMLAGGKSYRTLFVPANEEQNFGLLMVAVPAVFYLLDENHLFWFVCLITAISGVIYCIHHWLYRKRKLRYLSMVNKARVDRLTGLPNQHQLLKDLEHAEHTNLAFIKFNNYNSILNTYGPAITDGVIKQMSAVIAGFLHPLLRKSSCYYVNHSVFAILEDQDISLEGITTITKSLVVTIMSAQYQVGDGAYISVNVTTGAVRQNTDAFMLANMALREAESKKLQFYLIGENDSMLPETYKKDLALTQILLKGIKEHRVVAYYQPIFSVRDRQVEKYECLARLVDDQGDILLMPNVFIPLAHRANVYYQLTKTMIRHAVEFAHANQVVVTLNLSITDINNARTSEYLFYKIKTSGIGHLLQFELLENESIVELERIIEFINKLQSYGCKVGMDDLGKGHSNIERLLNLPVDFVKIDRTIMENVSQNLEMHNLARGIVELAHKKGFEVVAEYCANQALVNTAIDLGVDSLQGFFLGRPARTLFVSKEDAQVLS